MIIKEIQSLSDDGQVAELIVSDGIYECFAFSCPFKLSEGQIIQNPLYAFDTENLMLSDNEAYFIKQRKQGMFEHDCIAQVVDRSQQLVKIGGLSIVVDEILPVGCDDGTFVQFFCSRLNVFW